jgi:hypothetical protein
VAEVLENVNNKNKITTDFDFDIFSHPSLFRFEKFYTSLNNTIRRDLPLEIPGPKTPSPTTSPPPPTPVAVNIPSADKPDTEQATTPPLQTTNPVDPQYSSTSTSSNESKPELDTQALATDFLDSILRTLKRPLQQHAWYHSKDTSLQFTSYLPYPPRHFLTLVTKKCTSSSLADTSPQSVMAESPSSRKGTVMLASLFSVSKFTPSCTLY